MNILLVLYCSLSFTNFLQFYEYLPLRAKFVIQSYQRFFHLEYARSLCTIGGPDPLRSSYVPRAVDK